jgi:hypothetical protein
VFDDGSGVARRAVGSNGASMSSVIAAATARATGTSGSHKYDGNQLVGNVDDFLTDFEVEVQAGESASGNRGALSPPSMLDDDIGPPCSHGDDEGLAPHPPRAPLRRQLTEGDALPAQRGNLQDGNNAAERSNSNREDKISVGAAAAAEDDDAAFLAEMELLAGGGDDA